MSQEVCYGFNMQSPERETIPSLLAGVRATSIVLKNHYQSPLLTRSRALRRIRVLRSKLPRDLEFVEKEGSFHCVGRLRLIFCIWC